MRKVIIAAVTLVAASVMFIAGVAVGNYQPNCPTEDSCQIDYHDGYWSITPVTP